MKIEVFLANSEAEIMKIWRDVPNEILRLSRELQRRNERKLLQILKLGIFKFHISRDAVQPVHDNESRGSMSALSFSHFYISAGVFRTARRGGTSYYPSVGVR